MVMHLKYVTPSVELVRLQTEDLMAEVSCYPVIKYGDVKYTPYEEDTDTYNGDIVVF
jgi:hypothetical protein